jgi:hypothetical protein
MKPYISPDVHVKLFGNDSPNEVLKELVRWMASPSYQNFLKNRGLSSSDSWVDVFKIAVIGNSGVPIQPVKVDLTDIGSDIDSEISF